MLYMMMMMMFDVCLLLVKKRNDNEDIVTKIVFINCQAVTMMIDKNDVTEDVSPLMMMMLT